MKFFTRKPSPPRILGSDAFGPPLTITELRAGFVQSKDSPMWRCLGQIALAMREECVEHSGAALAGEKPMQAALHAGGANACAEFAQILADLSAGKVSDEVKGWFAETLKS